LDRDGNNAISFNGYFHDLNFNADQLADTVLQPRRVAGGSYEGRRPGGFVINADDDDAAVGVGEAGCRVGHCLGQGIRLLVAGFEHAAYATAGRILLAVENLTFVRVNLAASEHASDQFIDGGSKGVGTFNH
jgi:hypothetical protein